MACNIRKQKVASEKGFSLIELMITIMFISLSIIPVMRVYFIAEKNLAYSANEVVAVQLARDMMDEITALPFQDPNVQPSFGLEEETSGPVEGRLSFDDVDDYDIYSHSYGNSSAWGWQSPPRNIWGKPILEAKNYARIVSIVPVQEPDYSASNTRNAKTSALPAAFKLVTVRVKWDNKMITLRQIVADTNSVTAKAFYGNRNGHRKGKRKHGF